MSSPNITKNVRTEQAGKTIKYSNPASGNSTDFSGLDNYKDTNKDNIKFKDKNKDMDIYYDNDNYKDQDKEKDNVNNKDEKNDQEKNKDRGGNEDED